MLALITGITGQDGSYLAELLLDKGYEVHGILRRSSSFNTKRIDHIREQLQLHYGDVLDMSSLTSILSSIKDIMTKREEKCKLEIYNLAAQSHVKVSFEIPVYTTMTDGMGTLHLLEAVRSINLENDCKIYQASTSELYGKVIETPQTEKTPFYPRSPYGVAKLYSFWIMKNYRESYNMFCCNGILFNHESPRRGENFVTRKVTIGLGEILSGKKDCLVMGNLDSRRDWGHAKDYVKGMWMMMQRDKPDDFVLSTNEFHSVREFITKAFSIKNIEIEWRGSGLDEVGVDKNSGKILVKIDKKYYRPCEVDELLGDSTKAREEIGWTPETSFDSLIKDMVESDCDPKK